MAGGGEGREGDWECSGCRNRNYAFRSICNRCKQPRILVDTKTPADSKWLPRIGDWICSGCSNNNYASREQCKKCGQSKEEAAMPALAMPGASFPTYAHYFARAQGLLGLRMNYGMSANSSMQQPLGPYSSWQYGGMDKYGLQSGPNWSFGGSSNAFPYGDNGGQTAVPKGWRSGDWICDCGFHNYSSREQCKKCSAPVPTKPPSSVSTLAAADLFPTLGTKRLASEEFVNEWDNKRLNAGGYGNHFLSNREPNPYLGFEKHPGSSSGQLPGIYSKYSTANFPAGPGMRLQSPQQNRIPPLIGKGAKQWRDGDWMCANCNNHNFASRSVCNRCKTQKEGAVAEPVSVA